MIGLKRIVHVNLVVEDVEAAKEFYGRLLGLQEIARAEGTNRLTPTAVLMRVGEGHHFLCYNRRCCHLNTFSFAPTLNGCL